jgi:hypothetical protein
VVVIDYPLQVLCESCDQPIWKLVRPIVRGERVVPSVFAEGPHPVPQAGAQIDESCPVCGGSPFIGQAKMKFRVKTEAGLVP